MHDLKEDITFKIQLSLYECLVDVYGDNLEHLKLENSKSKEEQDLKSKLMDNNLDFLEFYQENIYELKENINALIGNGKDSEIFSAGVGSDNEHHWSWSLSAITLSNGYLLIDTDENVDGHSSYIYFFKNYNSFLVECAKCIDGIIDEASRAQSEYNENDRYDDEEIEIYGDFGIADYLIEKLSDPPAILNVIKNW